MPKRLLLIILLITAATGGWLMNYLVRTDSTISETFQLDPDYYMEDFTAITMGENGNPVNKLYAVYMEHNPVDDTFELDMPVLEIYREYDNPLNISAEKGWVTNNNEVILLRGNVRMLEVNSANEIVLNVETTEARVLLVDEYAESDQYVTITAKNATITGRGVRAHFNTSRLEILFHEQTIISKSDI